MTMIVLGGLALVGLAIALALRAAVLPRLQAAERMVDVQAYGYVADAGPGTAEGMKGINALAAVVGAAIARRYPRFNEDEIRRQLTAAGMYHTAPLTFLGARVMLAVGLPLLILWLGLSGGANGLLVVLGAVVAGLLGWRVPTIMLDRRAKDRLKDIDRDMPELVDLLIVTVEAGVGFSGSVQMAGGRLTGPLGDELRLAIREQQLGISTSEALVNMMHRADTASMRSFVRAVLQGEQLGVSIGQILRNLASEMRKRRRAYAEERAQKAPIKMLFPLVFLIFPSLFIVLLYPALYKISEAF